MRRKLIVGNWKMHGLSADLAEAEALSEAHPAPSCEVVICPPATLISRMWELLIGCPIGLGGQDCHAGASGANTGDISAEMLADAGAGYVILGHSERRIDHGETDAQIAEKARAAHAAGLVAILCLGETEAQRDAGEALEVIAGQLAGALPDGVTPENTVIAYEPVWAIGTGRIPAESEIAEVHAALRRALGQAVPAAAGGIRLLYGGSVKPGNAAGIFAIPDVDGALVGGASLRAADFAPIIAALDSAGG